MHVVITCNYSCQHKKIENCMASRAATINRLKSFDMRLLIDAYLLTSLPRNGDVGNEREITKGSPSQDQGRVTIRFSVE